MKKIFAGAAMLCILIAASCKKQDDNAGPAGTSVTIASPTPGQVFHVGDTVRIQGTAQYAGQLHGYEVTAADSATNTARWSSGTQHAHNNVLDIVQYWTPGADALGAVKIAVVVAVDHEGTEAREEVVIRVAP
jgi:hypothetical protein